MTAVFKGLLGDTFASLSPAVQAVHSGQGEKTWSGRATVQRGTKVLVRCIAWVFGFPATGKEVVVTVHVQCQDGTEIWRRNFGGQSFTSVLSVGRGASQGMLVETFGPFRFRIALAVMQGKLHWAVRSGTFLGVKLPKFLLPGGDTYEYESQGRFHFHVEIKSPLLGLIVKYQGWLEPQA